MTDAGGDESTSAAERSADRSTCEEDGCDRTAAVWLHVPWSDDRAVCPPHARVLARRDGVVAEPIEGTDAEWP